MAQMVMHTDLHIRCNECRTEYFIDKNYLEYDCECIDDRGMGAEFEHDFLGEKQCEICRNWMYYKVMAYEYPEGAFNDMDTETHGCELIERPEVDIDWSYEFDSSEYTEDELSFLVSDIEKQIYSIANNPGRVYELTSDEFEDLVAEVFRRKGFNVALTPRTRDGGKDIIASYNMNGIPCMLIIECKRYSRDNKVGVGMVRALHGVQQAEHYGKAVVVTSSSFSKDAQQFAGNLRDMIILVDFNQLMQMINDTMEY